MCCYPLTIRPFLTKKVKRPFTPVQSQFLKLLILWSRSRHRQSTKVENEILILDLCLFYVVYEQETSLSFLSTLRVSSIYAYLYSLSITEIMNPGTSYPVTSLIYKKMEINQSYNYFFKTSSVFGDTHNL